jgi:hypothetical protein
MISNVQSNAVPSESGNRKVYLAHLRHGRARTLLCGLYPEKC